MNFRWIFLLAPTLAFAGNHTPLLQQAPAAEAARTNPYEGQERAGRAGFKLFQKECSACHGSAAQGGRHAPALGSMAIRQASSGEIFWVLRNGSLIHGMPSFSHLPEQQRWQIIAYLKRLQR